MKKWETKSIQICSQNTNKIQKNERLKILQRDIKFYKEKIELCEKIINYRTNKGLIVFDFFSNKNVTTEMLLDPYLTKSICELEAEKIEKEIIQIKLTMGIDRKHITEFLEQKFEDLLNQ